MATASTRKRAAAIAPGRVRTSIVISAEAFKRLGSASVAENRDQSEIVELLIDQNLSGYVTQVRGPRLVWEKDRRGSSGDANSSASDEG